jgi:hypothetical protein
MHKAFHLSPFWKNNFTGCRIDGSYHSKERTEKKGDATHEANGLLNEFPACFHKNPHITYFGRQG